MYNIFNNSIGGIKMFDNIGGKVKGVAVGTFVIGSIASLIGGIVAMASAYDESIGMLIMLLIFAVGVLISWLSCLCLYGFGQLIENTDTIVEEIHKEENNKKTISE